MTARMRTFWHGDCFWEVPRHRQIARAHVLPGGVSRWVYPLNSLQSSGFLGGAQTSPNCARTRIARGGSRGVYPLNSLQSWRCPDITKLRARTRIARGGSRWVYPLNSLQSNGFWEVPRHHQIARAHVLPGGVQVGLPLNSLQSSNFWEVPRHHQIARAHVLPGGGSRWVYPLNSFQSSNFWE